MYTKLEDSDHSIRLPLCAYITSPICGEFGQNHSIVCCIVSQLVSILGNLFRGFRLHIFIVTLSVYLYRFFSRPWMSGRLSFPKNNLLFRCRTLDIKVTFHLHFLVHRCSYLICLVIYMKYIVRP